MGLTWIDHDTIEKPIEEIIMGTDKDVDFEFTVETLKTCNPIETTKKCSGITKKVEVNWKSQELDQSRHSLKNVSFHFTEILSIT